MVGYQCDAYARRHLQPIAFEGHRLCQQLAQLLGHVPYMASDLRALAAQPGQQYHEFVATEAGDGIFPAGTGFEAPGHHLQHAVADRVAERVVDVLEVIEVEKQQGTAQIVALVQGNLLHQALHEQGAVGQVGQRVVIGQMLDLGMRGLQHADVPGRQQHAFDAVELDGLHRNLDMLRPPVAVLAEHLPVGNATVARQQIENLLALIAGPYRKLRRGATDHLLGVIAGKAVETRVDFDEAPGAALADGDGVRAGMKRLGELGLAGSQRRLGLLPQGDVAEGGDDAELPIDTNETAGHHAGNWHAVAGAELGFDAVQMLFSPQLLIEHLSLRIVLPEADFRRGVPDDLACRPSEGLGEAGIDLQKGAVADARQAYRIGAALEECGELGFRCGQVLLAEHPLGDVHDDPGHAQGRASFVAIEPGGAFQMTYRTVLQPCLIGDLVIASLAFHEFAIGLAHPAAVFGQDAGEELLERAVIRAFGDALQFSGACRGVQGVAGDMPVPGSQFHRVQRQAEAFLAVLQLLRLEMLGADVAHQANQDRLPARIDLALADQFEPVEARVWPKDPVSYREIGGLAGYDRVEPGLDRGTILLDDQLQVAAAGGNLLCKEAEQLRCACRPLLGIGQVPGPDAQAGAVEHRHEARGIRQGLVRSGPLDAGVG